MNKIKIYFSPRWVNIAPPWLEVPDDLKHSSKNQYHDVGIDLNDYKAYVTNDDYYCNVDGDEIGVLSRMLDIAAAICWGKMTYEDVKESMEDFTFRGAVLYCVEE